MNTTISASSVSARFWASVDAQPKAIAIDDQQAISYAELGERASLIAWYILSSGDTIAPTQRKPSGKAIIALMLEHDAALITTIVGVTLSGCAYHPIDLSAPKNRILATLESCEPTAIIASQTQLTNAQNIAPSGCRVYLYDNALSSAVHRGRCSIERAPNDLAYVLSTSGSTGIPKLVAHSEKNTLRAVRHYQGDLGLSKDDKVALVIPCTYTPSVFCIFGALLNGARLCLFDLKKKTIVDMAHWLKQTEITLLYASPTIFRRLLNDVSDDDLFTSLRSIQLAGEPLFKSDIDNYQARFPKGFQLYNGMGSTETSCLSRCYIDASTQLSDSRVPIGKTYDDVDFKILDSKGHPVAEGEEGELVVSSEYFAEGYLNDTESSQVNFVQSEPKQSGNQNPTITYRTGDRARVDASGSIIHLGRLDDQVKLRGQRIELAEIEATMLRSKIATQAAACLITPDAAEPFIAAFFQPQRELGELRKYLSAYLPPYMIPTRIVSMDALPLNNAGKVDKQALQHFTFAAQNTGDTRDANNVLELHITECLQSVLKNPAIDVNSNFFDHGGDSLRAVELAIAIQHQLNVSINISCLVEAPTPKVLAPLVRELMEIEGIKYLVRFHDETYREQHLTAAIPIFCVPGMGGNALSFRALASEMLHSRAVYAIEYPGYNGEEINFSSVQDLVQLCFDAITRVYPNGEIALVCYSLGGVIGYELTRMLHNSGREVCNLVMIDCYAPRNMKVRHLSEAFVYCLKCIWNKHKDKTQKTSLMRERQHKVDTALTRAICAYSPQPQNLDNMLLIQAIDQAKPLGIFDNYSQWHSLNSAEITTVKVSGAHFDLITSAKAKEISTIINTAIGDDVGSQFQQENAEFYRSKLLAQLKNTWNFAGSTFPEINTTKQDLRHKQQALLSASEQLTARLSSYLGESIEPKILTSEQRGRFYYRKVALQTRESRRTAAIAAIRISMDKLSVSINEDIIAGKLAFGKILSKHRINYTCSNTRLFQAITNPSVCKDLLITDTKEQLHGRTNQFHNSDAELIADVVEILAPWV